MGVTALALVPALACNSYNNRNYANVPLAVGMVVAQAAIQRAATGGCWAQCEMGTRCNETTGLCEPVETFVSPSGAPSPPPSADPATVAEPEDETCAGYCLSDERCVVIPNGDVDCVPRVGEARTR